MTARPTPALWLYGGLAFAGGLAGLLLGRADLVAVAAAPAAFVLLGLALTSAPRIDVRARPGGPRLLEGEQVGVTVTVTSTARAQAVVELTLPAGLSAAADMARSAVRLRPGQPWTRELVVRADRWGAYGIGAGVVRVYGPAGLVVFAQPWDCRGELRVFPTVERLRSLVAPYRTQPTVGQRLSRAAGEGIEFADLRPLHPGDSLRTVNWRASTRRQALFTNQRHPERNADIVLFLDTFADAGSDLTDTLDRQVRAAAAVAAALLHRRDRVGVIGFGGVLSWLRPGSGTRQWYQLVDALLSSRILLSEAHKGIRILPVRALPPQALVLALTPLLDQRSIGALLDLRGRGFDMAVIEVSPFARPTPGPVGELAWRLWQLERAALRQRFRRMGVPLVEWHDGRPLESVISEVVAFRHTAQPSPA